MGFLDTARLNLAAGAVGLAQAALDDAIGYVKQREQFGRRLGSFQLVQEMVADIAVGVETARSLLHLALDHAQARSRERRFVAMAKAYCTETAAAVAAMNVQVHGAMGLSRESDAERYLRDARMLTIPDGTTQIQKLIIGRELLGISAFR
jgi:alkylation response protein AidB-like acyl-CoA dehydrogenase